MALQKQVEYWPNSQAVKETFTVDENGKKQGIAKSFYPNGALWGKVMYQNGKSKGAFIRYYPDGVVLEKGTYLHGWLDGLYEVYNQQGHVIKKGDLSSYFR